MRILITCFRLNLTGSSTFTVSLASSLRNRDVDVDVFSPFPEIMSDQLEQRGVRVNSNSEEIKHEKYDCIIAQHNILAALVRSIKPDVPMLFISHGILRAHASLEQPPSEDINIQKYIAVSEEVKNNLISSHHIPANDIEVLWNCVDVKRFSPHAKINERPKVVLFMSNRFTSNVYKTIKSACDKLQLKMIVIGKTKKVLNTEFYINKADIVISLGRGIIEAMACGRAAIVYDYQGGDGMVTKENIDEIRKNNFSGRRFKEKYDIEALIREIGKFESRMSEINRDIVVREHNASLAADRIINLSHEVQNKFSPQLKVISTKKYEDILYYHKLIDKIIPPNSLRRHLAYACWDIANRPFYKPK
jgi:glycosyltransferase involved in cell wall biosynthesis